ncbi:MAG: M23 family metallopeptidase [Actinomycetota bacterium]
MSAEESPVGPKPIGRLGRFFRRAGAGALLLYVLAVQLDGLWLTTLATGLLALTPLAVVARVALGARRELEWRLLTAPRSPGLGLHRAQWLIRGSVWLLAGGALWLACPAANLAPGEYAVVRWLYVGLAVALALLEALQPRTVHRSANVVFALALVLLASEVAKAERVPSGPTVALDPPFRGRWIVFHGGASSLINHHAGNEAQANALDLLIDARKSPEPPDRLESYAAWGQPLLAPAAGRVVVVENSLPDQPIGGSDPKNLVGNHVTLEIAPERYVLLAHLKKGSVRVKVGDEVKGGAILARCGNSGNTSEPHLHFQVQNRPDFTAPDLQTFPITWNTGAVTHEGKRLPPGSYVRRNDYLDGGAP